MDEVTREKPMPFPGSATGIAGAGEELVVSILVLRERE